MCDNQSPPALVLSESLLENRHPDTNIDQLLTIWRCDHESAVVGNHNNHNGSQRNPVIPTRRAS